MNTPRLLVKYRKEIVPQLRTKFGYKNLLAVPRVTKIVLNVGTGRYAREEKMTEVIERDLALIGSQKPVPTFAKKSIASFKIRQGMKIGRKVTLRGKRMYDFMDRLISVALPRTRDFHGLAPKSIISGTFSLGIPEHNIFPEVHYESLKEVFGLELSVITNAKRPEETLELLKLLGFPFKKGK